MHTTLVPLGLTIKADFETRAVLFELEAVLSFLVLPRLLC